MALLVAGCARPAVAPPSPRPSPADAAPVEAAPALVRLGEAEIRAVAEIMLMEDRRSLDPGRMTGLIAHWSPYVRRRAALALGRVRDATHVPPLLALLDDSVMDVRTEAAFALGLLADSSGSVINALARIARTHPTDSLGIEAVAALAKTAAAAAFDTLDSLLGATTPDSVTPAASEALMSLWRFGPRVAGAIGTLRPFTKSERATVRWRALYPLVRNSIGAAIPLCLDLADDPDPGVRALALRGLRSREGESVDGTGRVVAALMAGLADPDAHVRINALAGLASRGEHAGVTAVEALLDDADGNVRMAAVQALSRIGGAEAAASLDRISADDNRRTGIRFAAFGGLFAADQDRGRAMAMLFADSPRWIERMMAARTLAGGTWPADRPVLERLARDRDPRVARAAISSISRSTGEGGRPIFLTALRDSDARIRAAAISALGRLRSAADVAVLLDAYDQALPDSVPDAAIAAVNALALLARDGVPVQNAFFARFGAHPDTAVRRAVARRLGNRWGDEPDSGTERGIAFHEEVVRSLAVPALAGHAPPILRIGTPGGPIDIELAPADAPLTVHNIITLVESGYFSADGDPDARRWHRVVPDFVLQDGEPAGDGSGGPGYAIRDEINRLRYARGMLGMALSGPDTGGSQFFITVSPQPHLDGGYTVFGRVVSGMDVADRVVQDDRITSMEIIRR